MLCIAKLWYGYSASVQIFNFLNSRPFSCDEQSTIERGAGNDFYITAWFYVSVNCRNRTDISNIYLSRKYGFYLSWSCIKTLPLNLILISKCLFKIPISISVDKAIVITNTTKNTILIILLIYVPLIYCSLLMNDQKGHRPNSYSLQTMKFLITLFQRQKATLAAAAYCGQCRF